MTMHGAATTAKTSITSRDLSVLRDLYKYRYLSVSQVKRLHFPSLQTTYRRLRSLTSLGHIAGFLVPHIPEHIYHLDKGGAQLVAGDLGLSLTELKWRRPDRKPTDYYFMRHFIELNDFRITITQACSGASEIKLLGFIPEYVGETTSDGNVTKYLKETVCDVAQASYHIRHTPDAVFALEKRSTPALFFLEIDRGTEVVGREDKGVLKCVKFYLSLLASSQYQRYQQDFACPPFKGFRSLIVTTTEARVENIRQAITQLAIPAKAKQFIWLTHRGLLSEAGLFASIWLSADAGDQTVYRIG